METLTEIVSSRKIRDTKESITDKLRSVIYSAMFLKGFDLDSKDIAVMSQILEKDIRRSKLQNLTMEEVRYAVENGIRGEYGEYYGLNNVTLLNFLKAYSVSEQRAKALKVCNQKQLPEKASITDREKTQRIIQGIIQKFDDYKTTGRLYDFGNPGYDFLAKAGIINYTQERRDEFKAMARKKLIAEETLNQTIGNADARAEALKAIENIKNDTEDKRVIAEAKRIALKDFFNNLILMGEHIENLLKTQNAK